MIGLSLRLPVDLGQHDVGLGVGEEAAALHRRQLRRIAEHEHRLAEGEEVAPELLVDHRAFVDDDEVGLARPALERLMANCGPPSSDSRER